MASRVPLDGIRKGILGTSGPVSRISVTNFAASLCEVKSLYNKMKVQGQRSAAQTKALERGTQHHSRLDDRGAPVLPPVLPSSFRLLNTISRWNQLAIYGFGREIPLYGTYKGIKLYGIADGCELDADDRVMIVEDKTTWGSLPPHEYKMRLAYHQTLMYHHMITQMMSPDFDLMQFFDDHSDEAAEEDLIAPFLEDDVLSPSKLFGIDVGEDCYYDYERQYEDYLLMGHEDDPENMIYEHSYEYMPGYQQLTPEQQNALAFLEAARGTHGKLTKGRVYELLKIAFMRMQTSLAQRKLSNTILLRYQGNKTAESYEIEFDKETQDQLLEYCGQLWLGEREPSPFSSDDKLFCKGCEFKNICEFVARAENRGVHILAPAA